MLEKMETEIRTALDQLAADKRLLPEIQSKSASFSPPSSGLLNVA